MLLPLSPLPLRSKYRRSDVCCEKTLAFRESSAKCESRCQINGQRYRAEKALYAISVLIKYRESQLFDSTSSTEIVEIVLRGLDSFRDTRHRRVLADPDARLAIELTDAIHPSHLSRTSHD